MVSVKIIHLKVGFHKHRLFSGELQKKENKSEDLISHFESIIDTTKLYTTMSQFNEI